MWRICKEKCFINNYTFINKILSQAFMMRAKLKNKKQRYPTLENNEAFEKQRNYCVSLLRREIERVKRFTYLRCSVLKY